MKVDIHHLELGQVFEIKKALPSSEDAPGLQPGDKLTVMDYNDTGIILRNKATKTQAVMSFASLCYAIENGIFVAQEKSNANDEKSS